MLNFNLKSIEEGTIHAVINGTEYTYVSDIPASELFNKVQAISKHSVGKALAYLKKNAVGTKTVLQCEGQLSFM